MASFKNLISTTADSISSGGTISGDLTIEGDLTVDGGGGFAYSEVLTGDMSINGPEGTGAASAGLLVLSTAEETVRVGTVDQLGRIDFQAPSETGGSDAILVGASIFAEAEEDFSSTNNSTGLVFSTATTSAPIERMRIDQDGFVGIGTAAPDELVHIKSSGSNPTLKLEATTSSEVAIFRIQGDRTSEGDITSIIKTHNNGATAITEIRSLRGSSDTTGDLLFYTSNSEKMRIDEDGNVGIGATPAGASTPSLGASKLEVHGGAYNTSLLIKGSGANSGITFVDSGGVVDGYVYAAAETVGFLDAGGSWMVACENDTSITFSIQDANKMKLDANSRISLSNNDSGGTGGADSTSGNTLFGYLAGEDIADTGTTNTLIGHAAGKEITTGSGNTAVGIACGDAITDGEFNSLFGRNAGGAIVGGDQNTFIGNYAGANTASVQYCVAIGSQAANANMTTDANGTIAVGFKSLNALTDGAGNTAVGYEALKIQNAGQHGFNTAVGHQAGNVITSGIQNTIIGSDSDPSANSGANQTVIGYATTGVADNSVTLGNADVTDVYMAQDKGAVIHGSAIRTAGQVHTGTTGIGTLTLDTQIRIDGGFIEFVLATEGTMAVDDTMVFTYAKGSFSAWNLEIELMSTDGFGTFKVGGYNNNSATSFTVYEEDTNGMATLTATNSGQDNVITLTMNATQIHPTFKFKYTQGGADGAPTLDDVSIVFSVA